METYLEPSDIFTEFVEDLLHRLELNQHENSNNGNKPKTFKSWISIVWKTWFFPGYQSKFYAEQSLLQSINSDDLISTRTERLNAGEPRCFRVKLPEKSRHKAR